MASKITPQARRILAEVTWDARGPLEAVARKLRIKPHTVRRTLRLLEESVALTPVCWTHPYLLGEIPFRVFFRVNGGIPHRVREFEDFISSLPQVSWFVSLIGSYQYCATIRSQGPIDFFELSDRIDQRFRDVIADKSVSTVTHLSCYAPSNSELRKSFAYSATQDRLVLSPLDHKLLSFLRNKPLASIQDIARAAGSSRSTIDYRLSRLLDLGAIVAFAYSYDWATLGDSEFLISLSTKGFGSSCYDKIAQFCARHRNVVWLARFIGHWDIELSVNVHQAVDLETFIQELYAICRDQVAEVHIHTFSRLHRDR